MAHLRKKDDKKWQIILNVGINPKTGRQKRKTKIVNCSHSQAKEIMYKLAAKYEKDVYNSEIEIILKNYLKRWLKEICKDKLAARTYNDYAGVINNHIIPYMGNLKLQDIKPHHIIKYQNDKLNSGKLKGPGGLSKRTVQNHHRILSKALSDAIIPYRLLENNPCRDVKAPSPKKTEINPFSDKEIKLMLDSINEFHLYSIVFLDLYTGMRRGELAALKFNDINFSNQEIYIQRSVQEIRGEGLNYKETKNDSSKRNIYIDDDTMKVINKLKEHNKKIKHENNLVFTFPDGQKIRPNYITKKFKKILVLKIIDFMISDILTQHNYYKLELILKLFKKDLAIKK